MLAHEIIRKFAEEIIMSHELDSMEAVLYTDGDYWIRQSGSTGTHENEIMVKIPLGQAYWGEDLDDLIQMDHIMDDLIQDIYFRIEDWKVEQEELKKFRESFEADRKAYEDMIGL